MVLSDLRQKHTPAVFSFFCARTRTIAAHLSYNKAEVKNKKTNAGRRKAEALSQALSSFLLLIS